MAISLEERGVPTVAVHTNVFARLAKATALAAGMPRARQAFLPQPVVGVSPGELRNYIHGNDKVSGRPFVQEVIEGLTRPLDEEDLKGATFERSTPRLLEPDTEENLHELFIRNRWTDMLPVVLPTQERVERMLKGTSHAADKIVGKLRPTAFREFWEFDVEKVAVNAVMAGARPEYFPVILAMAASGQTARSSSTNSFATISIVNGPIRNEIGMDSGIGVMGPYNHANATIGRAYGLLSQNLQGGSVPGESYMGTLGNWYAYTACLPEAEERSPWEPFHVQHGFKPTDSTVSIFFGGWYTHAGQGPRETWQSLLIRTLVATDHYLPPFLVMDPVAARDFEKLGFSKQALIDWCAQNAKLPARDYWDNQWIQTLMHPLAVAGVEPYASKLKATPEELVTLFQPEDINIIVAGGETQGFWKIFGGRYGGRGPGAPATTTGKAAPATLSVDAWR
ncbi:MAG TPA: UGSC family (seleno)protein [Xanthobacteraceae bacterium]|nr:UGSC family (seleno)protein [Xanthobacteraceae bacterium]